MVTQPPNRSILVVLSALTTIVSIVIVIEFIDLPGDTRLWGEIQNAGHVPLFGMLAIATLLASIELFEGRLSLRYQHYLAALLISVAFGLMTEWLQLYDARDADPYDFLRDVAGIVSFLGLFALLDTKMRPTLAKPSKNILAIVSAVFLCASLAPLAFWLTAYVHRDLAFPKIVNFNSFWQRQFLRLQDAELVVTPPPKTWRALDRNQVGKLILRPAPYAGFWVQEPYPDWSGYRALTMNIYLEHDAPMVLTITVQDKQHNHEFSDRFTDRIKLSPGANIIVIPLEEIAIAPATRQLDLGNVGAIALLMNTPNVPCVIYIDSIRLE
jgi:hypothetical protein